MTTSEVSAPTKVIETTPRPTGRLIASGNTSTYVFEFKKVEHVLSKRPLRKPRADEDGFDVDAVEASIRENVFFSFDEICRDL